MIHIFDHALAVVSALFVAALVTAALFIPTAQSSAAITVFASLA
ncbi:hypothetical protein [Altererythrobacter aquiaggeris]